MKQVVWTAMMTATLSLSAQSAMAQGMNIYIPPQCELDLQHFLVRNAALYVKAATEAQSPEQQTSALQDSHRVLRDALERGEEANAGVWYFLGRTYMLEDDLDGADSAFTKAESITPDCADDIDTQRRFVWAPAYNEGITAWQSGDVTTAESLLTLADKISDKEPFVPYYLASILMNQDTPRAIDLFKKTVEMGVDTADYAESYQTSLFNAGRLHHIRREYDSAAVWYARYREVNPRDPEAIQSLASVLEAAGRQQEAREFYDSVLTYADVMSALDLFSTGVSLFRTEDFEVAVRAFELGLQKNPYYRDGVFNLTQAHFALANPQEGAAEEASAQEIAARSDSAERMLETALRLVEIDPANPASVRMLAAAYQLTGNQDSTVAVMSRVDSLAFQVTVQNFQRVASGGFNLQGEVSNLTDAEVTVPDIVFELVDTQGAVLATETVSGRTLNPQGSASFQFQPTIEGLAAWRYRIDGT